MGGGAAAVECTLVCNAGTPTPSKHFHPPARPSCLLQVIAFLDTGAGKTFVSVLLIRHRLAEQRRLAAAAAAEAGAAAAAAAAAAPASAADVAGGTAAAAAPTVPAPDVARTPPAPQHRVAVFLAPKVALVLQQADVLRQASTCRRARRRQPVTQAWTHWQALPALLNHSASRLACQPPIHSTSCHCGPCLQHLGADRVAHFVGEMGVDLWEKERCGSRGRVGWAARCARAATGRGLLHACTASTPTAPHAPTPPPVPLPGMLRLACLSCPSDYKVVMTLPVAGTLRLLSTTWSP